MMRLRDATLDDANVIVALNHEVVAVTSPMDHDRFRTLFAIADYCVVAEDARQVVGFVLAMKNGAPYENGNYDWFSQRLNQFVYIDRVVISAAGRGQGLGQRLYEHVATIAKSAGAYVMAAEMDLVPPNLGSLGFHEKHGFVKLGTRQLDSGKQVSMQILGL